MQSPKLSPYSKSGKPWKAKYKGKWYDVIEEEDQGPGKKNKYYLKGVPDGPVEIEDLDPFGIGGSLDKNKIIAILEKRYSGRQDRDAVESVAADVYYSGEPESVLASSVVLGNLFDDFLKRKREIEAKKSAAVDSNEFCPICKSATATVKLAGGRPARWCKSHFVVFPIKGETK